MSLRATAVLALVLLASAGGAGCVGESERPPSGPALVRALLLHDEHPRLRIEVDYASHLVPSREALRDLVSVLQQATGKPHVELLEPVSLGEVAPRNGTLWELAELVDLHWATQDAAPRTATTGDVVVLHVLYLPGSTDDGDEGHPLGLNILNALVIFPERIRWSGASVDDVEPDLPLDHPRLWEVERHVLVHEAGHALGLVDLGLPMVHPRLHADGAHSRYEASVMYPYARYPQDWNLVLQRDVPIVYRFDAYDLQDIRAFQARASSGE